MSTVGSTTSRRRFIQVAGGGIILAAIPITGCSSISDVPDSAIAAWEINLPPTQYREWILSHAILAPNPHNRQPWLVDLEEPDVITVSLDTDRLLPQTDPFGRQIMIGTGAMLGLLEMAANSRGYRVRFDYIGSNKNDQLPDAAPLVRAELQKLPIQIDCETQKLFIEAGNRHTERGLYDPNRMVPSEFQQRLKLLIEGQGRVISKKANPRQFSNISALVKQAWYIELSTPATMMESMNLLRVGSAEIDLHRDGITIDSRFLVMLDKLGLLDRSKPPRTDSRVFKRQIDEFNEAIDSTPAYYVQTSADNSRWSQLQAGRHYIKTQLLATSMGLSMHPVSQGLQEYEEVSETYTTMHKLINEENETTDHTVQMLARIGYLSASAKRSGPSPRRGLKAHLI